MNHLESLQSKIQKACPEIMELKFGCRVEDNEFQPREYIYACEESGQLENYPKTKEDLKKRFIRIQKSYSVGQQSSQVELNYFKKNFEIIGRPITLEDVLVALQKINKRFVVEANGMFLLINRLGSGGNTFGISWKLNTPLHLQPENTIKFLDELL